jgi:CDP-diacylglycerol--serine O-phosphatidyltransferase
MIAFARNNLPNLLTCLNLTCGILGIFILSQNGLESMNTIQWLLVGAGIADFFDGFVARLLKSTSSIGKDLDSLADGVTFGILPSLVAFLYLKTFENSGDGNQFLPYSAVLIGIFSIIRLARFNNDTRQTDHFIGVPTPANAFFLIFLTKNLLYNDLFFSLSQLNFIFLILAASLSLVMPLPLLALKFKSFSFIGNQARYLLIFLSLVAIVFFGKIAVPIIFLIYLFISIVLKLLPKNAV